MTQQQLEKEEAVFAANLAAWRETRLGEFVLIKGDEVVGFYPGLTEAFGAGTARFGLQAFLVRQIVPSDAVNISFYGRRVHAS